MADEGRWEFERNIGTGGFGLVKLFTNQITGAKIVLKECRLLSLSQEIIERWYGEMEILKRLDHPNIVKAQNIPRGLDPMTVGDTPCICMEFCDGGDLRQVLRDPDHCCGLEELQIRQICRDVTQGIKFLHSQRIIHRDLKPENILLKRTGESQVIYKLTDFGYAKQYDQSSVCTSLVGTMQYVAPEVLKDKKYHSSVDFWSFGVIVFECVTGRRPFLHGNPAANFAWVEFVAKKGEKDIHIYWEENKNEPTYSSHLPQPHRLSRPFESLMTSWLQVALNNNPHMRGCRSTISEEAPCLTNMEHSLNTWIVNALCMQTGDMYSYSIDSTNSVEDLKAHVHCSTGVSPTEIYLALPDGHILGNREPVSCCIRDGNIGIVYIFSTALDPSFKMMSTTNQDISQLIAYGDESIQQEDRRDVYSHAFFHIREQYHLFERLHKGHRAILSTIHRQCVQAREHEQTLRTAHVCAEALTSYIESMQQADTEQLQKVYNHKKNPVVAEVLRSWEPLTMQLQECVKTLSTLGIELSKMRQEMDTLLRLADDLKTSRDSNERDFYMYYQQFVMVSRKIYQDAKMNSGVSSVGRMADVLVGAKQQAEKIILERLNGYNFAQQYVAMETLLSGLGRKKEEISSLRREVTQLSDRRRSDMWKLLEQESFRAGPYHSLPASHYENWDPVTQSITSEAAATARDQKNAAHDSGLDRQTSRWSQRTDSSESADEMSVKSEQLGRSMQRVTRLVSVQENDKLEEENKVLLTRLTSLVESYHKTSESSNGSVVAMETNYAPSDVSTLRSNAYVPFSPDPSVYPH